jgi:hypothetical protein
MALTSAQIAKVLSAARTYPVTGPTQTVEQFYGDTLTLKDIELAENFPSPDPTGLSAIAVGRLTALREEILRDKCEVPSFVIYETTLGHCICGLVHYYTYVKVAANHPPDFIARLSQMRKVRNQLISIDKGHNLETLAAALLAKICRRGEATKGSGDQGIDAFGEHDLIPIDPVFIDGEINDSKIFPGQKVIIFASSKANVAKSDPPDIISPAHIRELVGGWLIQRSEVSMWKTLGVQMLTPLQLLLATTYRLSAESKLYCNRLGVQVWGIPELTYLICRYAPSEIFSVSSGFSVSRFEKWWKEKEGTKVFPVTV